MPKRLVLLQMKGNTNPKNVTWEWREETREELIREFHINWQVNDDYKIRLIQYGEFVPPMEESASILEFFMDKLDQEQFEDSITYPLIGGMMMLMNDPGSLPDFFIEKLEELLEDPKCTIDINRYQDDVRDYISRRLAMQSPPDDKKSE